MAYEKHSVWSEAARTPKLFVFDWRLLILVFLYTNMHSILTF